MHPLPHTYRINASTQYLGEVATKRSGLAPLYVSPPVEFDGPGNCWSPEELLAASIVDCFVLSFRAVARAVDFSWVSLSCNITATLDKQDRKMQFTHFLLEAELEVDTDDSLNRASTILENAERTCMISNSLKAPCELTYNIKNSTADTTL